ncbi:NACHT and WD domain protein [Xylariomycetidae sp. FL2044]|nr:NACHT and WD domain protein [Xylariomycetidae sp. FL2044]
MLLESCENSRDPTLWKSEPGPLGLNVIYTPENDYEANIVFVHGLGGNSRWTWSKNQDSRLFWPQTFLPLEPNIRRARILTFGYNANFLKVGNVGTSVLDFAKGLLFDLKYGQDDRGMDLDMGQVPLIFVVHSMGGLVVKEAYIQGQYDPEYQSIIQAISAIIFLATPHRGTNLAQTLHRVLQSTLVTSSKQYISDIVRNSSALQKLNEQFRHVAPKLNIVSFYETQPTSIKVANARVMVLEKDTSVLGYPGEISKPLDADHQGVCKYESPQDPNYVAVRNVLKSFMSKIIAPSRLGQPASSNRRQLRDLQSLLLIPEAPDKDYIFFRDQWVKGTSDWILQDKAYIEWSQGRGSNSSILRLYGGPATGKSVLSSFIINHLIEEGAICQYFFLRFGDQQKRSLSPLLRSIACQAAQSVSGFYDQLIDLADEAPDFETIEPRILWERIFKPAILKFLFDVSLFSSSVRIIVAGRSNTELTTTFSRVPKELKILSVSVENCVQDLRCYIHRELNMGGTSDFRESVIQRLMAGAQNNFLWIRLAVERLNSCHRVADVELALRELPPGMEALYDRMALSITERSSSEDHELALAVLQCVTCALRSLTVAEVAQTLGGMTHDLPDLQRSIVDVCGGFVMIDNGGNVTMIHQTAHEYLLGKDSRPFKVNPHAAHAMLFLSSMRTLMTVGLRGKVSRNQNPEFLDYAATLWSSHLIAALTNDSQIGDVLLKFLRSHWLLTWIHFLAVSNKLQVLVQSSKHLSEYSSRRRWNDSMQNRHGENDLLENLSIDLVKMIGKFGTSLRRSPETIYKQIPPFCPRSSSIYQLFGKQEGKNLEVSGTSMNHWDDKLARLSLGREVPGNVLIYDSITFNKGAASPIQHGENVETILLNSTASILVTYGYRTTKVWDVATGSCKVLALNLDPWTYSRPTRCLTMTLINNDNTLIAGTEDRRVKALDLNQPSPTWELIAELQEQDEEGHFLHASDHMAINRDGSLIAAACLRRPLSGWETDGPTLIGHSWRKQGASPGEVINAAWHPHLPELLGIYIEGVVFKWRPYEGEVEEIHTGGKCLAVSRDGNLFATGNEHGAIKIYTTADFCLLYQIASQHPVSSLTFGPDIRRLYDLRAYHANVWEPTALMRFAEQQSAKGSGTQSLSTSSAQSPTGSPTGSQRFDAITTLAPSPLGTLYGVGTETGLVYLCDKRRGEAVKIGLENSSAVEKMIWSRDGRYMCFSNSDRCVFTIPISSDAYNGSPVASKMTRVHLEPMENHAITDLFFHDDSTHLVVVTGLAQSNSASSTNMALHIVSVTSRTVIHSLELPGPQCKWIAHPQDPKLLLGFGPGLVHVVHWQSLGLQTYCVDESPDTDTASRDGGIESTTVDRLIVSHDRADVLLQLLHVGPCVRKRAFYYLPLVSLKSSSTSSHAGHVSKIVPTPVPPNISSQIFVALSLLSHNRLIYLSRDFAICSWHVPPIRESTFDLPAPHASGPRVQPREVFALPGDWISRDCLRLSCVWAAEGSFLCPRNGGAAIVKCASLA